MADNKQSSQRRGSELVDKVKDAGAGAGDKVKDAAAGAGTTTQQGGQKTSEAAGGAVNVVKEKTGMNK